MRGFGGVVLALGVIALAVTAFIYFVKGGAWVGEKVLPVLLWFSKHALWLAATCLVLALVPSWRGAAGFWLSICSIVFGLTLWLIGFIVTYEHWGVVGVAIGIFLFGIGVVPVAMVASLVNGSWVMLGILVAGALATFFARWGGLLLMANAQSRANHSNEAT